MSEDDNAPNVVVPAGYTRPEIGGRPGRTLVFAGLDANGIPVALKTLHPHARELPLTRARFEAECRWHLRVNGAQHVVPLRLPLPPDWLVTSWAHGGTLADYISRHAQQQTVTQAAVLRIVKALLEACRTLSDHGVVHRDIKPSNVLLDGDTVWLSDFDLAAGRESDGTWRSLPAPWAETDIGTPEWNAPELQCAPPESHPANDVYGVGRVWEALVALGDGESQRFAELRASMLEGNPHKRATAAAVLAHLMRE